ncbi:hypothetical protein COO60DRAFT_1524831, partial [Scenedesmus sp. NREL 46B-D3]
MANTAVATGVPTLHTLGTIKNVAPEHLSPNPRADAAAVRDTTLLAQRDTVHIPVPEDDVLQEETAFAGSSAQAASVAAGRAARQQHKPRSGLLALLTCSCLKEPSVPDVSDSRAASGEPRLAACTLLLGALSGQSTHVRDMAQLPHFRRWIVTTAITASRAVLTGLCSWKVLLPHGSATLLRHKPCTVLCADPACTMPTIRCTVSCSQTFACTIMFPNVCMFPAWLKAAA